MSRRSYHFGEYRVDPTLREVWLADRLLALPPHVFDCLTYLIERHDRAVGRDELVAAVWGKTEVSDTLLGQTVLRIRREFGDNAKDQRILRTIPRFGYRWVAPLDIRESSDASSARVAPPQPAANRNAEMQVETVAVVTPAPINRKRWLAKVAFGALAVAVGAGAIWLLRLHVGVAPRSASALVDRPPISAVMPATVVEGTEWAWMRLGVMDIIAGRLRSSGLPSVPSENVVALLNAPAANRVGTVGEALGARLLVTPHVQHLQDSSWQVDLEAEDAGQHYATQAHAHDATEAARAATDKLLVALGHEPADAARESTLDATLMKRIDAAVLADDASAARALIAQASAQQQASPELRLRLAKLDFRAGQLDAARQRLIALLDEAPEKTEPVLRASVLNGLGAVAIRADNASQAEQTFGAAIKLLEAQAEPAQLGQAYLGRAAAAEEQRHFEAAAADYARARIALRQANDTLALIRVAADEGFLDLDIGRPAQALPQFVAATEGFKQWGALNEAILTYIGQIGCRLDLLENREAMEAADAADTLAQRIDNPATLASLILARARALGAVGRLREARAALDDLRSASDDPITVAAAGVVLARLELDSNHAAAAGDLADRAVSALNAPSYARLRAEAWLTQVRVAIRTADAARAAKLIAALDDWAGKTDEPRAALFARLARAEYALQFGDGNSWRSAFDGARDFAARNAVPYEIAAVTASYADALLGYHDFDTAQVEVGRISRWSDQDFVCAALEARLYAALGRNEARQTAVARARALAGERGIPADALAVPISTGTAAQ